MKPVLSYKSPIYAGMRFRAGLRAHWSTPFYQSTYLMSANLLVSMLSGVGFWILASRLLAPAEIGIANAFVAPATFLSIACLLGANYGVLRFAQEISRDNGLLFGTIWMTALAGLFGGAIGATLLLSLGVLLPITGSPVMSVVLYAFLVSAGTVWTVCESAFVGLRSPWQMLARNIGCGFTRIALLLPFATLGAVGLVVAFTGGTFLAALLSIDLLRRHLRPPKSVFYTIWRPGMRKLIHFALPNHLLNLAANIPHTILPLMVLHMLGAEVNGYFAMAWTLTSVLRIILTAASTTLLAEGARDRHLISTNIVRSIGFLFAVVGLAALPIILIPELILAPFGKAYVVANRDTVRLFALAILPAVLTTVFVARERVIGRIRFSVALTLAYCVLTVALPYLGASTSGYGGFAVWHLISQCLLGLAVLPMLIRRQDVQ
jgi:O-antigen/teichoic acid export membrane protein